MFKVLRTVLLAVVHLQYVWGTYIVGLEEVQLDHEWSGPYTTSSAWLAVGGGRFGAIILLSTMVAIFTFIVYLFVGVFYTFMYLTSNVILAFIF